MLAILQFVSCQAHSAFRYVVMGGNARRCLRTQKEIVVSKTELPVKKLNLVFLANSVLLHYIIVVCFVRYMSKGLSTLHSQSGSDQDKSTSVVSTLQVD